jgi:hypothetical protein
MLSAGVTISAMLQVNCVQFSCGTEYLSLYFNICFRLYAYNPELLVLYVHILIEVYLKYAVIMN